MMEQQQEIKLENHWQQQVVGIQVLVLVMLGTISQATMQQVSQRFRGATVTTMVISAMLAIAVTGGVLQRAPLQMHTAGTCTTIATIWAATITVSIMGFRCVVSGIDLFGYLII